MNNQSGRRLPMVRINKKLYYLDERLLQVRNISDPTDFEDISPAVAEYLKKHTEMSEAFKSFIKAAQNLSAVWDNAQMKGKYPDYLPSFDEFVVDFSGLMGE